MWIPLALAVAAVAAPLQDPLPGVVRGMVRSERTGEPVPFAVVEVVGTLVPIVASADTLGTYELRGVPAGRRLLRARGFDHSPFELEVLVPQGREVRLDFTLRLQPLELQGVVVQGVRSERGIDSGGAAEPELGRAVVRTLEATPGLAELGLLQISRAVRPGQEPVDPSDVLYVRGAPADLKLVLLDGAPVYAPFHAGGLLQAFDPDLVRRADLYLGGAPARYDGGLSYVLDLETRGADQTGLHASGAVDLLTAQTVVEAPIGADAGLLLSARAVHGFGADWILSDRFPYGFADLLGRADIAVGSEGTIRVTGFWNRESIRLDDGSARATEATWGSRAASLRYRGALLGQTAEFTLATGGYQALLPLGGIGGVVVDGVVEQSRVVAAFSGGSEGARIHYGASYERLRLEQRGWATEADEMGIGAESASMLGARSTGESGGVYADLDWGAAPRIRVRGGLRADLFSTTAGVHIGPRLSVSWALSERALLSVAGGQYRQLVREGAQVMADTDGFGGVRTPNSLRVARASHLLLSLDQLLADEVRFGIEGYFKRFHGVPTDAGAADANASGMDLWLRRGAGRITGWLGYSLGWVWTAPMSDQSANLFSGRQLLSLGVVGEMGKGGRLGLRVGYGAGVPYTSLPYAPETGGGLAPLQDQRGTLDNAREIAIDAPPVAGAPESPYLRLDAELSYPWNTRWGGARVTITPYLKVYNALDRRDAFFYRTDGSQDGPRPLAAFPMLPVLGLQWRF